MTKFVIESLRVASVERGYDDVQIWPSPASLGCDFLGEGHTSEYGLGFSFQFGHEGAPRVAVMSQPGKSSDGWLNCP